MNFPPLDRLPHRLRNKITLEIPSLGERLSCWTWTGSFTKPRTQRRLYRPHHDEAHEPKTSGYRENVRGVPTVRVTGRPAPAPAFRVVYAASTGRELDDVRKLARCPCDRCVSPYHVTETTAGVKKPAGGGVFILKRPDQIMTLLRQARPVTECGSGLAAEELGLAAIPDEVWQAYLIWDAENPELED